MTDLDATTRWDDEYRAGRYLEEPSVPFVDEIASAVQALRPSGDVGLYIGCGNGRNYIPLVDQHQLDLIGLDISGVAIQQLARRRPEFKDRLIHGDLSAVSAGRRFGTVIGIQVFQHGSEAVAHDHVRAAVGRLLPDGLICIRVNAESTELEYDHEIVEQNEHGGFTICYLEGPKEGLLVHFFAEPELNDLLSHLTPVSDLQLDRTFRQPPKSGYWDQWQGIWQNTTSLPALRPRATARAVSGTGPVEPRPGRRGLP